MGVLRLFNVAPTQLHPNSWASMQVFRILCKYLLLFPSLEIFLYFYSSRSGTRSSWSSLISRLKACLLSPFTSSYKNFKGGFFKILIQKIEKKYFYDGNVPKFPFYWTSTPLKFNSWSSHSMNAEDRHVLSVLDILFRKLPTRALLRIYLSPKMEKDFISMSFCKFSFLNKRILTLLNFLSDFRFDGCYKS